MKRVDNVIMEEDIDITEAMVSYFNTVYTSYRGEEMPEMQNMTEQQIGNIILPKKWWRLNCKN